VQSVADRIPQLVAPVSNLLAADKGEAKEVEKQAAKVEKTEEAAGPEGTEAAKEKVNNVYMDKIKQNSEAYYNELGVAQYGYSLEDWNRVLAQATDNYNPKKVAGILFKGQPDERKKYLQTYDTYLKLKDIDLEAALAPGKEAPGWQQGILAFQGKEAPTPKASSVTEADRLKDIIAAASSDSKLPRSELDKRIQLISKDKKLKMPDKIAELKRMFSTYGIDMGLYEGVGV
jgi:hypothetical protein